MWKCLGDVVGRLEAGCGGFALKEGQKAIWGGEDILVDWEMSGCRAVESFQVSRITSTHGLIRFFSLRA